MTEKRRPPAWRPPRGEMGEYSFMDHFVDLPLWYRSNVKKMFMANGNSVTILLYLL